MQFTLQLVATRSGTLIPFNYQYLLTGWLYRLLQRADEQYTQFLHQHGYRTDGRMGARKTFRLFTFSDLRMNRYAVRPRQGGFELLSPEVSLTLSFYIDRAAEAFVMGLFQNQQCRLVNRSYEANLVVERVETLPVSQLTNTVHLRTLSPVVVAERDQTGMDQYLHPADDQFGPLLLLNLVDKYRSAWPDAPPPVVQNFSYELLTKPGSVRSRLVTIKEGSREETKVRGWYGFDFALRGPADVLEVGLLAGVGRYNAEGFGCVRVVGTGTT